MIRYYVATYSYVYIYTTLMSAYWHDGSHKHIYVHVQSYIYFQYNYIYHPPIATSTRQALLHCAIFQSVPIIGQNCCTWTKDVLSLTQQWFAFVIV